MRKNASLVHKLDKPKKDVYIYALCEPESNNVKYIGLATNNFNRIKQHWGSGIEKIEGKTSKVKLWIHNLRKTSKIFNIIYLEYFDCDGPWVDEAEQKWIKFYLENKIELLNHEAGGRRNGGHIDKEAYSNKMSVVNSTPEKLKLFSEQSTARWADPEFREMMKTIPRKEISKEDREYIHKCAADKYGVKIEDELGNRFNTLQEAADFHGIHKTMAQRASITGKLCNGHTFKRLGGGKKNPKDIKLNPPKTGRKPIVNEVIDHNGIIYQNIKIACEALGIDNKKAHRLLNGEIKNPCGITLKRVVK